ncbi:DUF445 domain-containing protein [Sphingomonas sp. CGMCC 1.13654]|uniref:DUF445 domain-containing protein n=1 Tax=Sphingomonas chungangi TaxID=2683589 RepID=A0A838L159_9SPHN|nr:DUF445 domain-containing protein [Sphingomonas chungangi]MBA2932787.1 DUF445 domain-containing protein [Sphingomonas chungangi]MVW56409.1 DUF445 family protein [Sphingomonas chungangi]
MRLVATGLLVVMALVYVASRAAEAHHPAFGYVRAFAEAAMVGGLADWFAVTALFRHPLGLPIPHTAIIPKNKDRIGDALASFLRQNFLIPSVVARRMRRLDLAGATGRFLAAPGPAADKASRLRLGASRLIADVVSALDAERLGGMVRSAVSQRLSAFNVAPVLGQALAAAIDRDRHVPILDNAIDWVGRTLVANEETIRAMISAKAGSVMRWTGLDETLANKILDGLYRLIEEVGEDPEHPLRDKAEEGLVDLARRLREDEGLQARVNAFKDEIIASPAVAAWLDGLWAQARAALLKGARDPDAAMAGRLGETLRQLGQTLQSEPRLARTINLFARRAAVGIAAAYGDGIVRLVSDTVRSWDAKTVTGRLEQAVGRDLQYIRVNGTLVGGMVGLLIHVVDVWL